MLIKVIAGMVCVVSLSACMLCVNTINGPRAEAEAVNVLDIRPDTPEEIRKSEEANREKKMLSRLNSWIEDDRGADSKKEPRIFEISCNY